MTAVQDIDRFLKELGTRHLVQVLRQVLARWGLVLAVGLLALHWFFPDLLLWSLGLSLATVLAGVAWNAWRRGVRVREVDRYLELKDRLTTWELLRRRGPPDDTPMGRWLAVDLAADLEAIPEQDRQSAVARQVGVIRYLLPVLILLLLMQPLSPFGGPGGGASGLGGSGPGGTGGGPGGSSGPGESESLPGEQEQAPPTEGPTPLPPPPILPMPTPPLEGPPPPPEGANPMADLEVRDEFAVPHFVGEGVTRRQMARQARVAEQDPAPPPTAGGEAAEGEPPAVEEMDFEQAFERALQSRHVPEEERAFLRRYFRILREGSR